MVVSVFEITGRRALVNRAVAIELAEQVSAEQDIAPLTLDFSGIEAVGPSFLDELLGRISELGGAEVRILLIKNAPSRLSEKFKAVARGRDASIKQVGDSDWEVQLPAPV